jgi:UDP-N-acetylmuramyl pentapeptide synthase
MLLTDLAKAVGGYCQVFRDQPGTFSSVSVDSRTLEPGGLFAALIGSERDGHRFAEEAFAKGASG